MTMNRSVQIHRREEQGSTLLMSLILLLVMTVLTFTGGSNTIMDERMALNTRDRQSALEAAEAALKAAESYIESSIITTSAFDTNGADGLYNSSFSLLWTLVDWNSSDGTNTKEAITHSGFGVSYSVAAAPKYIIEHYGSVGEEADTVNVDNYGQGTGAGKVELFRITARGVGGTDKAVVYLQTTYGKLL